MSSQNGVHRETLDVRDKIDLATDISMTSAYGVQPTITFTD